MDRTEIRMIERKIIIGKLDTDTGEFAAAATAAPYFCFVTDTEKEARRLANGAAEFYENELPMIMEPVHPRSETVTNLTPHEVIVKMDQYGGAGTVPPRIRRKAGPIIMTHIHYIKLDDVSNETLACHGYECLCENQDYKHYKQQSTGEVHTVNKADPYLYIDDINDAWASGRNTIRVPHQ